jgi:hypothetical protein
MDRLSYTNKLLAIGIALFVLATFAAFSISVP